MISASQIVNIVPRVMTAGGVDLETVGMFITKNALCPFPNTMVFGDANGVGKYFGVNTDEYEMAVKYFMGYDNSFRKPTKLYFGRWVDTAIPGVYIGNGQVESIETIKAITNGKVVFNINGTEVTATAIDFSEVETQSDVASVLSNKLNTATVTYNSVLNTYIVTSNTTGETSKVEFVSDGGSGGEEDETQPVAEKLGLLTGVAWKGSTALTPQENMQAIENLNQNWVSLVTVGQPTNEQVEGFAKWINGKNSEYAYYPTIIGKSNAKEVAQDFADKDYEGVLINVGTNQDLSVFCASIPACIDWNRINALPTWKFKSQSGMETTVNDSTLALECEELHINFYGKYATRNDNFNYYVSGAMIGGKFGFIDAFIGQLWLRSALQTAIVANFGKVGRVPYNAEGYTIIRAWCIDVINRALVNGVINTKVTMNDAQKAQLIYEIGEDVSDQIYNNGYYLQVKDPDPTVRINRGSPVLGLWYTYGGAVHKVDMPVTAIV